MLRAVVICRERSVYFLRWPLARYRYFQVDGCNGFIDERGLIMVLKGFWLYKD